MNSNFLSLEEHLQNKWKVDWQSYCLRGGYCNMGSKGHCEHVGGLIGGTGGKALGKSTILSLKLEWYSPLEIIKLKLYIC